MAITRRAVPAVRAVLARERDLGEYRLGIEHEGGGGRPIPPEEVALDPRLHVRELPAHLLQRDLHASVVRLASHRVAGVGPLVAFHQKACRIKTVDIFGVARQFA